MKPFDQCNVCQNVADAGNGDCPYHGTPEAPKPHKCIDWSDNRPCCLLAERARDYYDSIRRGARNVGRHLTDREAGQLVELKMGYPALEALRKVYNLG